MLAEMAKTMLEKLGYTVTTRSDSLSGLSGAYPTRTSGVLYGNGHGRLQTSTPALLPVSVLDKTEKCRFARSVQAIRGGKNTSLRGSVSFPYRQRIVRPL